MEQVQFFLTEEDFSEIAQLDPGKVILVRALHRQLDFAESIAQGPNPNLSSGREKQKLSLDEVPLAQLENGHVFPIKIAPGRHEFQSGDATLSVDVRAGDELYLRVYSHHHFLKRPVSYLEFVAEDEANEDMFELGATNSDEIFAAYKFYIAGVGNHRVEKFDANANYQPVWDAWKRERAVRRTSGNRWSP